MSNMYAIKDTTLTALGDAVRNKTNGTTELPLPISKENVNGGPYSLEVVEFPAFVKTIKVMGHIYDVDISNLNPQGILHNLAYASGVYTRELDVRKASDFTAINPNWAGIGYDFEITVKSNALTFTTEMGYNSWQLTFVYDYTAIGLDENGNEFKYTPLEMVDAINELEIIPDSALNLTGNCNYRFANGGYDWLINNCGEKMTTKDITSMDYMFSNSNIETIPFEINGYGGQVNVMNCFSGSKIKQLPKMNLPKIGPLSNLFNTAYYLREIPDDKWNVGAYTGHTNAYDNHTGIFSSCYSLRYITPKLLSNIWNKADGYYYSCYYGVFSSCYVLDEIVNLPIVLSGYTGDAFSNAFNYCNRLKDMIFETNEDGTVKITGWKNQTLDLSPFVGYALQRNNILNWNSGITEDKEVKDDATYQALKNDPDWFSVDVNYSRYNHTSAVNTINSLPDCSATGTNNIKFRGQAGALTDGGAINTLTEEEIAVASAKGWTVSLV